MAGNQLKLPEHCLMSLILGFTRKSGMNQSCLLKRSKKQVVLVNNTGHTKLLISHTEPATNHRWMNEGGPNCSTLYRLPHRTPYALGLADGL